MKTALMGAEELLDISAIARLLGVSRQAIWDRWARGRLPEPDAQVGGKRLWKRETIEAWQEERGEG